MRRSMIIIQCTMRIFFTFLFVLVVICLLCFYLALGILIGAVMYAIMVVPSILLFLFVVIKKNFVWNNTKGGKSSSAKQKNEV